jgi:DNA-binding response OmpR family regulator
MTRVLLLDDDARYAAELGAFLQLNGCQFHAIRDPNLIRADIATFAPDVVLLDQRLGSTTGTEVLRDMRGWTDLPCIMVTALSDPIDRVVNLEVGADDEVEKTVSPRELLARIRALLRRDKGSGSPGAGHPGRRGPAMRGWEIASEQRELRRPDGTVCVLSTAEFDTLNLLFLAGGKPVHRSAICERVFGRPFRAGDRSIDSLIVKLRRKLEPDGVARAIKTVRPVGYAFTGFQERET